jgi:hypothetical protein
MVHSRQIDDTQRTLALLTLFLIMVPPDLFRIEEQQAVFYILVWLVSLLGKHALHHQGKRILIQKI